MAEFLLWMLESSLLVLMILGIRKAFTGRISYGAVYALWLVAALRFVVPAGVIQTPFGVGTMVSDAVSAWKVSETQKAAVSGEAAKNTGAVVKLSGKNVIANVSGKGKAQEHVQRQSTGNGKSTEQMKRMYPGKRTESSWNTKLKGLPWKRIGIAGWISISGMVFCFFLWSNVSLMRRLAVDRRLLGHQEHVAVYATNVLQTPCLYGLLRPVIYLPESLLEREPEEIEQMVVHEYVHYLHRDYFWAMLRILLLSVYWFDPFVWIAASCSKKDAELFCDETVIRRLGEDKRLAYGSLLVQIAGERHWGDFRYSMMPMSRRGREMRRRILAISQPKKYSRWITVPLVMIVSAAILLTCSSGVGMAMNKNHKGQTEQAVSNAAQIGKMTGSADPLLLERLPGLMEMDMARNPLLMTVPGEYRVEVSEENASESAAQQKMSDEDAEVCRKLFEKYVAVFTGSINSGKTGQLKLVLKEGTDVYAQQKAVAQNYHKRGIREKAKSCDVALVKILSESQIQIHSREQIKVTYGDATTKLIRQSYRYTCEKENGQWLITVMDGDGR